MKSLVLVLIVGSLVLPFGRSLADQTTAPGQQKKEAGAGSAKEYAPGQDKASEATEEAKEKGDKTKADSGKATPDVGAAKTKGAKAKKK